MNSPWTPEKKIRHTAVQQKSRQAEFASKAGLGSDSTVYSDLELDDAVFSLDSMNSKDEKSRTGSCSNSMVIESD
jgi:hypothetical protein